MLHAKDSDPEFKQELGLIWEMTMAEVTVKKTILGPFTMKEMEERYGRGRFRPCECFMTAQSIAPDGTITWRCIDNHKGNGDSFMAWAMEVISLVNPAFPAKICCWFDRYVIDQGWAEEGYEWDVGSGTDDGLNAFRFCPNGRPAYQCRYVMYPGTHAIFSFEISCFSFGHRVAMYSTRAPPK